jgi:lysyl-tRNA synthetase class I
VNKEELEQAFNETTDNAVNLLKENVELKNIIREETYEFYREQTLLLTEEYKELKERIDKAIKYIEQYCIDDEFYINLSKKEKNIKRK